MFEQFRTCGTEFSKPECEKTCCQWRKILETPPDLREGLFDPLVDLMVASTKKGVANSEGWLGGGGLEELLEWDKKHWGKAEKLTMFPPWVSGYGLVRFVLWEARSSAPRRGPTTDEALRAAAGKMK